MNAKKSNANSSPVKGCCASPDIRPAFAERNIPVAVSTDEKYLPYVKVLINSIVASTKSGNLDMLIINDGLTLKREKEFLKDFKGQDGVSIRFLNIGKFVKSTVLSEFEQKRYLSVAACYRLFLPELLVAYDKIIYLDVDTTVCRDLGELYAIDLGDNLFGAATDVVNSSRNLEYAEWARGHGFVEWDNYVNTGVLLLNLDAFRKAKLLNKLLPIAVEASKWFCDQDALNFVCKGRIASLDNLWNVQVGNYCLKQQMELTKDKAYIYHFTGDNKPWNNPEHKFAYFWWKHSGANGVSLWRNCLGQDEPSQIDAIPQISVIVPVFNAEKYLWECLMSVLKAPGSSHIEVICIDDGSTDGSLTILETLQKLDPRVKLIRQSHQGAGVARNAGLDVATGEYIVFLDADDRMATGDVLLRAYEQAKRDRLDMLLAASSIIAEDGRTLQTFAGLNCDLIPKEPVFAPDALGAALFLVASPGPHGKLYRRAFLEANQLRFPPLKRSEDFPLVQLAITLSSRIGVLAQPLFEYRIGVATSLESTKDETPLIFFEAEQVFRDSLRKRKLWSRFRAALYTGFVPKLAYNLGRVQRYSSHMAIIAKYREKRQQWIRWQDVAMPERFANAVQLVKAVEVDMAEEDHIALFVKFREQRFRGELWTEHKALKSELLATKSELSKAQKRRGELWAERVALKSELLATKSELSKAQKRRGELWAEREAMKSELSATKGALAEAQKRRGEVWAERVALKSDLAATKSELSEVQKRRGEVWAEREAMKSELAAAKGVLAAAQKRRGELWAERMVLKSELSAAKGALAEAQKRRGEVWAEREALKSKLAATKNELAEAQKRRGEVWAEREAMKSELVAAKGVLAAAQKRRGEVWAEREAMKSELSVAKNELAAAQKRRGEVWAEREAMKSELAAAKGALAAAQKRRGEVWAEREAMKSELVAAKGVLAAAQKRRGEVWAEREALKAALRRNKQAADKSRAELLTRLKAAEKTKAKIWQERCALTAVLRDLQGTIDEGN